MLNIVWKCKKVHHEICVFCLGISSSIGVYVPENFLIVNCIIKHICMLTLQSKLWNWHAYSVTRRHVLFFFIFQCSKQVDEISYYILKEKNSNKYVYKIELKKFQYYI